MIYTTGMDEQPSISAEQIDHDKLIQRIGYRIEHIVLIAAFIGHINCSPFKSQPFCHKVPPVDPHRSINNFHPGAYSNSRWFGC